MKCGFVQKQTAIFSPLRACVSVHECCLLEKYQQFENIVSFNYNSAKVLKIFYSEQAMKVHLGLNSSFQPFLSLSFFYIIILQSFLYGVNISV